MKFASVLLLAIVAIAEAKRCSNKRPSSKLICYYSDVSDVDTCMCSHIILPPNSDIQTIESVKEKFKGGSVLLTVREFNEDLVNILKNTKVDGLEINLKKLDDKNDVPDFISTVKSKLGSDLHFAVSIPSKAETLAKFYDLKALTKHADFFILQTAFLGASHNVTFHPSRLSGMWDMQNIDSVVDLVTGMGAPLSKLVISSPVQAFQFTLQHEDHTAPGSPAVEVKSLTREELCKKMSSGSNWTLERDQDQAGPYIFRKKVWIAFDDVTSMDIKAKYARVRGLAGLALKDLSQDGGEKCGELLLEAAYNGLSKQTRAPRGAVLQSLEREILETPSRLLDTVQVSPYRISRVIDVEGNVHSIRQDTRTEFECARQGYYVHPRSCGRFYRCVKFDQLSDDFNVFEFDCPAGLSFDSRYEVCVWPGSLPYSSACSGSSEIAPVPRTRFVCPGTEGYYADPENCRWFFACLDHGKSPLSAYEFRCPFGLVFDEERLVCEWPWLVARCASGGAVGFEYASHAAYGGAARLDGYDGLGALGVVNLGGLSGSFVEPQAKVYTSVSGAGIGNSAHQGAGLAFGNINSGYTGSAHLATSGLSGTGIGQSAHQGAGVVFGNLGYTGSGHLATSGVSGAGISQAHQGAGVVLGNVNSGYSGSAHLANSGVSGHSSTVFHGHGSAAGLAGQDITGGSGIAIVDGSHAGSFGNLNSFTGGSVISHDTSGAAIGNAGLHGSSYQTNINYGQNGLRTDKVQLSGVNLVGDGFSSLKTGNVVNHGITLQQPAAVFTSSGAHSQRGSSNYQANLAELSKVVHGNIENHQTVVTATPVEKIHIVGGFSAVGAGNLNSGIDISQNGLDLNGVTHVTPAPPISVSTVSVVSPSPVAAVAAAPVPVVKSDVETYEGGVVANVPELQYKIVTPNTNDLYYESNFKSNSDYSFSRGASGIANISHVNFISTTPSPVSLSTINYGYYTPAASFVQGSTVKPLLVAGENTVVHTGYHYPKPTIAFEEEPIKPLKSAAVSSFSFGNHASAGNVLAANTYTASAPIIQPVQPAVVSSYNFQNSAALKSEGYSYVKPTIAFEEKPVQIVQPVRPAVVSSFSINNVQKPVEIVQPVVSVTPTVPIIQHNVQPAVVSSFSFQNHAKNEEASLKAFQPVVSVTHTEPIIQQNVQQAGISGYSFQSHANENRQYTDSAASFKTVQPIVNVPVVQQNVQPAVISSYRFQNHVNNAGYQYTKPTVAVKVAEPVVSVTPIVPIVEHNVHSVQPAVVSSFSFQNLARNEDYKRTQSVQPIVSVTPATPIFKETLQQQPAVVSSYSFHNNLAKQQTIPVVSVTPAAPVIQHNIQPVQPAVVSSYSFHNLANQNYEYTKPAAPVQPTGESYSFQTIVGNEGYTRHSVPVQPVQHVPSVVPVVQQKVQPAVVSSYNFQNYENDDYSRQRVQSVQPTIVSSYSFGSAVDNEGYKYVKQTVPVQPIQPIVSVTPVIPVVQQKAQPAVVSSYSFQNDHVFSKQIAPVQPVVSVTPTVPIVQQTIHSVQPSLISSHNYQNLTNTRNYNYNNQYIQPVTSVTSIVPILHENVRPVQPAVVSSYNFQNHAREQGYDYSKKTVQVQPIQTFASVTPAVPIVKQAVQPVAPAVVSSYSFNTAARNENYDHSSFSGYSYPKPQIAFEEVPVPSVTPIIPVVEQVRPVAPSVVSSYNFQNHAREQGYDYSKKTLQVQPIQTFASVTPVVPVVKQAVQPVAPAVVSSYSFNTAARNENYDHSSFSGYSYPKPQIEFEEVPVPSVTPIIPVVEQVRPVAPAVVSSYSFQNAAINKNADYINTEIKQIQPVQPTVVSSFSIHNSAESQSQGYSYTKPQIVFQEKPIQPLKPAVVSSYSFPQSTTARPIVAVAPVVPVVEQKLQTVQPVIVSPQPTFIPVKSPQTVVTNAGFVDKLAVTNYKTSGNFQQSVAVGGYDYPKPSISFNEGPVISYENRQPVQEVPFVAKKAYVTGARQSQAAVVGYNYPKPVVAFEEVPRIQSSTVNPFQQYYIESARNSLVTNSYKAQAAASTPVYVENYSYTPRSDIYISTPAPFKARGRARVNVNTYNTDLYVSTPKPTYTSTVATVLANKSPPFQFYDSRLQSTASPLAQSTVVSTTPYVISTPAPIISTTTQSYVDVTPPTRTYLPIQKVAEEYFTAPIRPVVTSESKPKTYVRVNDFHPFLSAKLGAQCTCRSNTVTLRRKPVTTTPAYTDDDYNDGYGIKSSYIPSKPEVVIPVQKSGLVVENYAYEPQRIVEVTPNPLIVVQSTTNAIAPVPTPGLPVRKLVRVRPVTTPATVFSSVSPVTYAPEIFIKQAVTPIVPVLNQIESRQYTQEVPNDGAGVNLVKSTAKVSAKESLSSNTFDRYGPGGWRSRHETLQGTIDCQRAGLFRHPEQCNKFYACRWDCTKKRFTLHVFNCPVHLTFDSNVGACNWPSQGPACAGNTLLPNE